ncbi:hypothetical protein [Streptomyces odontomachi]|uniref:hypothetical protein n=1 Tax=Streptomyces odontomachi TaxID=2944940 RepID=UPI00210C6EF9|nr:hypothetical protein [Streptomyces sp. ODS25]
MVLSISALLLFGLFVVLLVRFKAVGVGAAIVTLLFGFYLARSGAAEPIDQVMTAVADAVRDIGN